MRTHKLGKKMGSNSKTSIWVSIALGSFTVIAAIIGSRLENLSWLLYLCGLILAVSFLFLIWDRFVGLTLRNYFIKRSTRRIQRKYFISYFNIIKNFRVLEELDKALSLDKLEWDNRRPNLHGSVQNALSSIEHGLNSIPYEHRLIASNLLLREVVRPFDSWLSTCDRLLKNGHVTYKTEDVRNEVLYQLRKYNDYTEKHDEFCRDINNKISSSEINLVGLYCQPHGFNWKKAEPNA